MTTAQELINSAASLAGVLAEGQTLKGGINTDALNRLNRMLDRWQNNGVDFGLGVLTAASVLYVDLADEEAIEFQLAVRLMARHARPLNAVLVREADDALVELQAKYSNVKEMPLDIALTRRNPYNIRTDNA